MKKLVLLLGAVLGFVLGSKAGRAPYERLERTIRGRLDGASGAPTPAPEDLVTVVTPTAETTTARESGLDDELGQTFPSSDLPSTAEEPSHAHRPMTTLSTTDILQLLVDDHSAASVLLTQFESLPPEDRATHFCEVVTELVAHEIAEEHVVYPIIRKAGSDGKAEASARILEQSEVAELLAEMEKLDMTSEEFTTKLERLRQSVINHAKAEEGTTFPLLAAMEDAESRVALGGRYEHAKAVAPTHPHPHAPDTPPANLVLDPVAALLDKARDAVRNV